MKAPDERPDTVVLAASTLSLGSAAAARATPVAAMASMAMTAAREMTRDFILVSSMPLRARFLNLARRENDAAVVVALLPHSLCLLQSPAQCIPQAFVFGKVLVLQKRQVRRDLLQTTGRALALDLLDLLPHRNELPERPRLRRVGMLLEDQSAKRIRDAAELATITLLRNHIDFSLG